MAILNKGEVMRADWKTWEGGLRPVGGDVMVQYQMRDGDRSIAEAGRLEWEQYQVDSDIVAYRVHRPEEQPAAPPEQKPHSHYHKDVSKYSSIDVYRVLDLFGVTDQAIGHAAKKLLVAGGRGHKGLVHDVQDVIDTLERWKEMRKEDANAETV